MRVNYVKITFMKKKLPLIVSVAGGLGNQLFRVLSALQVANNHDRDIVLDLSWFSRKSNLNSDNLRVFELGYFPAFKDIKILNFNLHPMIKLSKIILKRLPKKFKAILGFCDSFDNFRNSEKIKMLDCDSQKITYLPQDQIIKSYLRFPVEESTWFKQQVILMKIDKPISIHIRMTDYLNYPEVYNMLTPDYYFMGVSLLRKKLGQDCKVWLFSDDQLTASKWLGKALKIDKIVYQDPGINPGEMMRLLSLSRGVIMANSTFSWWASFIGYLNGTVTDIVMPREFTNGNQGNVNLVMNDWTVLDLP
jgi:hypothetical protein